MKANKILPIVAFTALILTLAYGLILAYTPKAEFLQGQVEAREYNISSKVPGRIEQVMVQRGDQVAVGDLLYVINSPELNAKLMQAEGGRDAAQAQLEKADKGARIHQITASKDQWRKAQAAAKLRYATYLRINNLFEDGVLARQKRDEAFTQWQAANYTQKAALAMYEMAKEGAREETKAAAAGQAKMAEGAVNEVTAILADSQMRSPKKAEVTDVLMQAGELAPSGFPVVSLIDMNDAWGVFQVREDQLKNFTMGKKVMINIPSMEKEFEFTVTYIAVMGDFATWRATESGHDFDMKTFTIELRSTKEIENLRVGMSLIIAL